MDKITRIYRSGDKGVEHGCKIDSHDNNSGGGNAHVAGNQCIR